MRKRRIRGNGFLAARGFTLVEVILAVSIATVLMYAIYRATGMYYQQRQSGREIVERAQLVRALVDRMRADIRSTMTNWSPPVASDGSATDSAGSSSSSSGSSTTSTSTGSTAGTDATSSSTTDGSSGSTTTGTVTMPGDLSPGGVSGDMNWMSLVVAISPTRLAALATADAPWGSTVLSDVRVVQYSVDPAQGGLIRREVLRVPAELVSTDAEAVTISQALAPEVVTISLRYFDGAEWVTAWDQTRTAAPSAIEVTFELAPIQAAPLMAAPEATPKLVRFVEALPFLAPASGEESASTSSTSTASSSTSGSTSGNSTGSSTSGAGP